MTDNRYTKAAEELGRLVTEKQAAYGDAFGRAAKILAILYPDGVRPDQYQDMLAVTRILDKLSRIATDRDALGESPYRDIAGYGLLGMVAGEKPGGGPEVCPPEDDDCPYCAFRRRGQLTPETVLGDAHACKQCARLTENPKEEAPTEEESRESFCANAHYCLCLEAGMSCPNVAEVDYPGACVCKEREPE